MPLTDTNVTLGETKFIINKLLPQDSKMVFMKHVRPMLGGAQNAQLAGADSEGWKILLAAFTDAPYDHYEAMCKEMYSTITYSNANTQGEYMVLAGDESNAFVGLDMAHTLILDVRAFAVNFSESWDVMLSAFPTLSRLLAQLGTPT